MLTSLKLKQIYRTHKDSIDNDFYIPCFFESIKLYRAAGYFSLQSLILSMDGLIRFVRKGGTINLVCSPDLTQVDAALIDAGTSLSPEYITKGMLEQITKKSLSDNDVMQLDIICNMLYEKKLVIKIAYQPLGIYHEKFGVFVDTEDNKVYFTGSMNETRMAKTCNSESIMVVRGWINKESTSLVEQELKYFNNLWNNTEEDVVVLDFPEAVKHELFNIYKRSDSLDDAINLYINKNLQHQPKKQLYDFQNQAIDEFCANAYHHFYEMATGTGKTFTAIKTIERLQKEIKESIFTVILVPQIDLQSQWKESLEEEGYVVYLFGGESVNTENAISESVISYNIDDVNIIAIAVYDTFFDKVYDRIDMIDNLFIIVDEAHNLNPGQLKKMPNAEYRLGLSATIQRFSKIETENVMRYFLPDGSKTFYYGIEDAIEHDFLSKYEYYPIFVNLTNKEFKEYQSKTKSIAVEINKPKEERDQNHLETLLRERSVFVKKADNKITKLAEMLTEGYDFHNSVVYCGQGKRGVDNEESIIDKVTKQLGSSGLDVSQFTSKTVDRPRVLFEFEKGYYDTLVAIKCFDEGVDVPKLDKIYIMASDTALRQTVQRRGRVLRKCKESNKTIAYIYDMIAMPPSFIDIDELGARSLVINELRRVLEYNRLAENKSENQTIFENLMEDYSITEDDFNNNIEDYE